eukprot:TRINITY_DN6179_c0_g1_i1.p1 TRINITY_DN6179_c0_g1~~TRINITY_DN6179_c0_g1_i1.p1  ORF type:complete len:312 (+),score=97.83 TRINITY_DN6179_c0_g1_i1:994-1929(+)
MENNQNQTMSEYIPFEGTDDTPPSINTEQPKADPGLTNLEDGSENNDIHSEYSDFESENESEEIMVTINNEVVQNEIQQQNTMSNFAPRQPGYPPKRGPYMQMPMQMPGAPPGNFHGRMMRGMGPTTGQLPKYQENGPFEIDLDSLEEKGWRRYGADISDWFNYGFNEVTWRDYCRKQIQMRMENQMQGKIKVFEGKDRRRGKNDDRYSNYGRGRHDYDNRSPERRDSRHERGRSERNTESRRSRERRDRKRSSRSKDRRSDGRSEKRRSDKRSERRDENSRSRRAKDEKSPRKRERSDSMKEPDRKRAKR